MKIVLQRVKEASVVVGGEVVSAIGRGILLFVGIGKDVSPEDAKKLAIKITKMRIFEDANGKMNLDLFQIGGEVLSVSQFTLMADLSKGNRPGFDLAALPKEAEELIGIFNDEIRANGLKVSEGRFGAHMQVNLVNDGPVTFVMN
ncbi:MAG: D-tyrosyl-tRNA(Tyr) deacylase [Candidatus Omnitrophica bacterium]|nr:D-tyrosyl-tRNA(Tyr) deacylase [Candidatus Omnitrophota bacterium]